ncbi:hypothetical protein Pelo_17086 [Pelomyxa schiedti]|nr:hypothetical protein Pelo_17086 [Pelomyxa schiedti]
MGWAVVACAVCVEVLCASVSDVLLWVMLDSCERRSKNSRQPRVCMLGAESGWGGNPGTPLFYAGLWGVGSLRTLSIVGLGVAANLGVTCCSLDAKAWPLDRVDDGLRNTGYMVCLESLRVVLFETNSRLGMQKSINACVAESSSFQRSIVTTVPHVSTTYRIYVENVSPKLVQYIKRDTIFRDPKSINYLYGYTCKELLFSAFHVFYHFLLVLLSSRSILRDLSLVFPPLVGMIICGFPMEKSTNVLSDNLSQLHRATPGSTVAICGDNHRAG